jgi:hypothetical protein
MLWSTTRTERSIASGGARSSAPTLKGLRVARRLPDGYEDLWRERVERMGQLISDSPKEADQ